jgi:hypothetical protein
VVRAFDEVRDASDIAEVSGLRNSIGAQEFAADFSEPYRSRGFETRWEGRSGTRHPSIFSLGVRSERVEPAPVEVTPAFGTYRPALAVESSKRTTLLAGLTITPRDFLGGAASLSIETRWRESREQSRVADAWRALVRAEYARDIGASRLVSVTFAGVTDSESPLDAFRAGGPMSGPGYRAHQFSSRALAWQRAEWQFPVAFPSFPLGRWGRSPSRATLAPLAALVVQEERSANGNRWVAGYSAIGAGLLVFFDLVRFDIARGLRDGRWTFGVDLTRDLWRIL